MIDLKKYQRLKEKKVASLVRAGDSYAVAYKQFDVETGEGLPDKVLGANMQELENKKESLQAEIVEINAFIADCTALN